MRTAVALIAVAFANNALASSDGEEVYRMYVRMLLCAAIAAELQDTAKRDGFVRAAEDALDIALSHRNNGDPFLEDMLDPTSYARPDRASIIGADYENAQRRAEDSVTLGRGSDMNERRKNGYQSLYDERQCVRVERFMR